MRGIAGGGDVFWGKNQSWLKCVDPRDGKELWSYALGKHTLTSAAVHEGLVYATDADGVVHCVDEKTGGNAFEQREFGQCADLLGYADERACLLVFKACFAGDDADFSQVWLSRLASSIP